MQTFKKNYLMKLIWKLNRWSSYLYFIWLLNNQMYNLFFLNLFVSNFLLICKICYELSLNVR